MRIKFVTKDVDRHGRVRWYFRRGREPKVSLPDPQSPDFHAAYAACVSGKAKEPPKPVAGFGTVSHAIQLYYASLEYAELSDGTKRSYRNVLERFRQHVGREPIKSLDARQIGALVDEIAKTHPGAADFLLKRIRGVMRAAVKAGLLEANPARDVQGRKRRTAGHHSWTDDERAQYEATHSVGSKARLAYELLLCTGQRRSDVVRLGPQHAKDGRLTFRQAKTRAELSIPVCDRLADVLAASETGHLAYLITEWGKPMTAAGFGNWFRDRCDEAGLSARCRAHGLRKAAGALLAEAGCSAHEIMSILGHASLAMAELYTRGANQRKLADSAMAKTFGERKSVQPSKRLDNSGEKVSRINARK